MTWETFQDEAFGLTKAEIKVLSRDVLSYYTEARKGIEADIEKLYLKHLTGVKPEDYYNEIIKRNILKDNLAKITADYNAWSRKAGNMVAQASELAMSNTYYRKLFATQWLAPELNFGYLPRSLIELTTYSTEDAWKGVKEGIINTYGSLNNYTSKAGTLTSFLVNDRQREVKKIQQAIVSGLQQGKSYTAMASDIKDIIGKVLQKDGVTKITGAKASAMKTIRTEGNRAMNAGSYANSKYADSEGIDIKRMIISTLDIRTRAQSAAIDGQKRGVDEPFTYPGGVTAMYPGTTGIAKYDINDREAVGDLVGDYTPQIRRGRNPTTDKDDPNYGKNEVFSYKDFPEWAKEKGLKKNKYGELLPTESIK